MNDKKIWYGLAVVGAVVFLACGNPTGATYPTTDKVATTATTVATTPAGVAETVGQKNARRKASEYLSNMHFSHSGLVKQLEFEGFPHEDALYGVDQSKADWNAQAAGKAKSYLEHSSFSKKGLIDQLKFEGFTQAEAEYGVSTTGL